MCRSPVYSASQFYAFSVSPFCSPYTGREKEVLCRKGNNIPESDLKAKDSYLFNTRYFQEWLFSRPLNALSTSVPQLSRVAFSSKNITLLAQLSPSVCYAQYPKA